jgi:alpha-N-arabinofuranosidase
MTGEIHFDKYYTKGEVDRRLGGTFIEHLGRCLYNGLYEPGHPSADSLGFRNDVKDLVRDLGISIIRYPGGNFVSGYNWKDGVGPRDKRPTLRELAWGAMETNQVGVNEFAEYCRNTGAELIYTVNLGTGTPAEAGELVDYCNGFGGTLWSDRRRSHGIEKPEGIKLWCLGNEMDGKWQIGALDAPSYARKARESAKIMRWMDPDIKLIACGSCSNEKPHKSFAEWDRIVCEEAYDYFDYLSLHRYYDYRPKKSEAFYDIEEDITDVPFFPRDLQDYLDTVLSACDFVKGKGRKEKTIMISFDEYGVNTERLPVPGMGNENTYVSCSLLDSIIYGGMLCTFINNADRIKIACQSLLINESGILSTLPGGKVIRQIPYYVLKDFIHLAQGEALRFRTTELPEAKTNHHGLQKTITAAGTFDKRNGKLRVFVVNSSLDTGCPLKISFGSFKSVKPLFHSVLYDDDWKTANTFEHEDRVYPQQEFLDGIGLSGGITVNIRKHSWNVLEFDAE